MATRRPLILMGILLILVLGYVSRPLRYQILGGGHASRPAQLAPLPGKNSVTDLKVTRGANGLWTADFDYFYTGEPAYAALLFELYPRPATTPGPGASPTHGSFIVSAQRGPQHVSIPVHYPGSEMRTLQVAVEMHTLPAGAVLASQQVDQAIDWPNWQMWNRDVDLAKHTSEENLSRAVDYIDSGRAARLGEAKLILERLINRDARFDAAYVELARVAMKTNWSREGLHQAENLLASALQIRPDSANAKILLGYVYTHQGRPAKAEALFVEAASANPRNLWLWTNWGDLLAAQGKVAQAEVKYREAITRPMTHDTYDRARSDAYKGLIAIARQRSDFAGMEVLFKKRVAEFGPGSCYSADYARFLLQERGDTQGAIDLARAALNQDCEDSESREILGLAQYVKWAATSGAERAESLNEARIYLPAGPKPLYLLAGSARTVTAVKQLVAAGEPLDQKDNDKLTALAYALQHRDLAAAARLLALGAHWDTTVGYADVPLALVPVIEGDADAIALLQKSGVDYSKLRHRGLSAFDIAKQTGNDALLDLLGHQRSAL